MLVSLRILIANIRLSGQGWTGGLDWSFLIGRSLFVSVGKWASQRRQWRAMQNVQ
jgi:hypothetical protein